MQILEAAIHLDLHNYSHHSQPLSKFVKFQYNEYIDLLCQTVFSF